MPEENQQGTEFTVPEAYQGKGWVEKIKSSDDLWKSLDNAQSLIGRKTIPAADAPEAEWEKFYSAVGRPESPDKYELPDVEGIPEGVDLSQFKQKAASIAHSVGLTPKQANKLWDLYLKEELSAVSTGKENSRKLDAEFDALVSERWGDRWDAVSKQTIEAVTKAVPENLRGFLKELSPKGLAAIVSLVEGNSREIEAVRKEYGAEGKLASGQQTTAESTDEKRKRLAVARASVAYSDFHHPEHKNTMSLVDKLSAEVQAALNRK